MLKIIPIPAFKDNYIWALHDRHYAVVVDPGDPAPVRIWLEANQCTLAAILNTHHHFDHTGGICELARLYNVPVYGPRHEDIPCLSHAVGEGDAIELVELGIRLKVFDIPGHTLGHVAYLTPANIAESGKLFCGDTLFGCGCGRLFEGTAAQLFHSLKLLAALPDTTQVYCAHEYTEVNIRFAMTCEPNNLQLKQRQTDACLIRADGQPTLPSTIGLEKATNPFLRTTAPEIITSLQQRAMDTGDQLAVFTALREWRNHF
jgi:hydroxyacylglutathione hydrolase